MGRFVSADTVVPDGSQGYDRFAYVDNNPIRYVDPDGHDSTPPPSTWWNPFSWNTVSAGVIYNLKAPIGVSVALLGHVNWGAVKEAISQGTTEPLKDFEMSVNLELSISVGASAEEDLEGAIIGSNESVQDQGGLSIVKPFSSVPVNLGGCAVICVKAVSDVDLENGTINSFGIQGGGGVGGDASIDLINVSFPLLYGNPFAGEEEMHGPSLIYFIEEVIEDISEYGE